MKDIKKSTVDLLKLVRKNIVAMKPYSSARDEFTGEAEIFLDANESPFASAYHRYPDPLQVELKKKIALNKSLKWDQIFLGNGSDEAIDLLIRIFCEPNRDGILITQPTYGMYSVCADVNGVRTTAITLNEDFDIDLDATLRALDASTKIIFLCSPNNPSGNLLSRNKIQIILEKFSGLVVIDEAYIDFASSKSFVEELEVYPNLVVLQTFSKAWGLAGLRLGMAFASPEIIRLMNKVKYPYNINVITQALALEALDNVDRVSRCVDEILRERIRLESNLKALRIVERVFPSDANFLLVRFINAEEVYNYLLRNKIIVRDRSRVVHCEGCLRITIGTANENEKLINVLRTL